jgi:HicA toxin of bacterial toxin-antitoxin,
LIPNIGIKYFVNSKNRQTLTLIFVDPLRPDVRWSDIESLLKALDAKLSEGRGSRIRVSINGMDAVFHRPHPQPVTDKGALKAFRRFLESAGIKPSGAKP